MRMLSFLLWFGGWCASDRGAGRLGSGLQRVRIEPLRVASLLLNSA